MEAVSTSEMSVNFYETTHRSIPEYSHLQACPRQNVKCHQRIEYLFGPVTGIVRDSSEDNTSPTPANNSETARDGKTIEIR
jgi:hypothetical protein